MVYLSIIVNLNIYLRSYNSTPKDAAHQISWESTLRGHECGSSDYVCLEHFTSSDYNVSRDEKRYSLWADAIPTIFEVFLIEVTGDNDDFAFDENSNNTFDTVSINHKKLQDVVEQLKSKFQSNQIFMTERIKYLTKIKQDQAKEINSLNKQISTFKLKVNELKKNIADYKLDMDSLFTDSEVNIFVYFTQVRNFLI